MNNQETNNIDLQQLQKVNTSKHPTRQYTRRETVHKRIRRYVWSHV